MIKYSRSLNRAVVCALFAVALLPSVGYAQTGTAAPSVTSNASSAAPADAVRLELAKQLTDEMMEQMNVGKLFDGLSGNMKTMFVDMSRKQSPTQNAQYHERVGTIVAREMAVMQKELMAKLMPKMLLGMRNLYATRFTEDELQSILTYTRSPVAKKQIQITAAELPALMTPMLTEMQAELPAIAQRMQSALEREGIALKRN